MVPIMSTLNQNLIRVFNAFRFSTGMVGMVNPEPGMVGMVMVDHTQNPIGSMYAIYGNIYHQYTPNVSI